MSPSPSDPLPENAEEQLVSAAIAGDREALERLLATSYGRLYTLCRRICTSREQAEDATQNALVSIVRGLPDFDRRARFSTWSHRIASNAAIDELRRARRRDVERPARVPGDPGRRRSTALDPGENAAGSVTRPNPMPDPQEHTIGSETRRRLSRELALVDERFRVPMVLRDVGQLDYDEIAELLDIPPGTVRSRISRGRTALRAALAGTDLDPSGPSGARTGRPNSGEPDAPGNREHAADVETERR